MTEEQYPPSKGDIWIVNLNPTKGHEQAGKRPVCIISSNRMNHSACGLVIVIPLTSKEKKNISHVPLETTETGLTKKSYAKCEDIRSISTSRLEKYCGNIHALSMKKIEKVVSVLLEL